MESFRRIIEEALKEDIGAGDVTSSIVDEKEVEAKIISKEEAILAGLFCAELTFKLLDKDIKFLSFYSDGERVKEKEVVATLQGKARAILSGERVALNFLCRLSGIATATAQMVSIAKEYGVQIMDTRKTTPCLRELEKYAVRVGGGRNHRFNLQDGVIIKENHIKACGSIKEAVKRAREKVHHLLKVEVEVKNLEELEEALQADVDVIMLDGLSLEDIKNGIKMIREKKPNILIEVSGLKKEMVKEVARLSPDFISLGFITHSAPAKDFSLLIQ